MTKPLVSVIIPTFNRADVIGNAVESVLRQSYKNIEVIVVDDGSTDHTESILKRYGQKINVLRQENTGASVARNRGAAKANGEVLAFIDSDDLWFETKIERQISLLEKVNYRVSCCLSNAVLKYGNLDQRLSFEISQLKPRFSEGVWSNPFDILSTRFVFFTQAVVIPKNRWAIIKGFNPRLRYCEDYDLAFQLADLGPWGYINEPLVIWNGGSNDSLTNRALHSDNYNYWKSQQVVWNMAATYNRPKTMKSQILWSIKKRLIDKKLSFLSPGSKNRPGILLLHIHFLSTLMKILNKSNFYPKLVDFPLSLDDGLPGIAKP